MNSRVNADLTQETATIMQHRHVGANDGDDEEESKVAATGQVTVNQTGRFASISNVSCLPVHFCLLADLTNTFHLIKGCNSEHQ